MEVSTMIVIAVVVVVILYAIVIYNNLVSLKHAIGQAWSNIDVLLKQRHDELPKLVETCKQYMKHERETLELVMKARSAVASARQAHDVGGLGEAEGMLRLGLGNLFAVAEAYPDLKADEGFRHLRTRITGKHVGNAVVFLASNQTPTTGATLPIDGGIPGAFPR